ncbi:hypothetical protein L1887_62751 [Cichorium endivia]|nr:hypothetical protein L1887_62751 [Cichorium endivia]
MLLDPIFVTAYLKTGSLIALSAPSGPAGLDSPPDDTVCLDGQGTLVLSLCKDTYQTLGLTGRASHFSRLSSGEQRIEPAVPTRASSSSCRCSSPSFVPGKKGYQHALDRLRAWDPRTHTQARSSTNNGSDTRFVQLPASARRWRDCDERPRDLGHALRLVASRTCCRRDHARRLVRLVRRQRDPLSRPPRASEPSARVAHPRPGPCRDRVRLGAQARRFHAARSLTAALEHSLSVSMAALPRRSARNNRVGGTCVAWRQCGAHLRQARPDVRLCPSALQPARPHGQTHPRRHARRASAAQPAAHRAHHSRARCARLGAARHHAASQVGDHDVRRLCARPRSRGGPKCRSARCTVRQNCPATRPPNLTAKVRMSMTWQ